MPVAVHADNPVVAEALACDAAFAVGDSGVQAPTPEGPVRYADYRARLLALADCPLGRGATLSADGTVRGESGGAARLTEREAALLRAIAGDPDATRESLMAEVLGYSETAESHTLETHLWRVRAKLAEAGTGLTLEAAQNGAYRLVPAT
ncbi:hypothetical protein FACS1894186_6670 [Alphaproteobacteria bacterium]|nr:hypothetical protein FACS1894186_6670 [Alphaproteobacteria bacterium]